MYRFRAHGEDLLDEAARIDGLAGTVASLSLDQIITDAQVAPRNFAAWRARMGARIGALDLTPDLGADIGSRRWVRGFATMLGLATVALALWPGIEPLEAAPPPAYDAATRSLYRSQAIAPLALGADSGQRMGPTALVSALAAAPERPRIEVSATLTHGDTLARMLGRAGLSKADINAALALVGRSVSPSAIAPGTRIDVTLGRRAAPGAPRPLENLAFRARFDLELAIGRTDAEEPLVATQTLIRTDNTPLRIRGTVGDSLYRSARAAGAPASAVQAYLRALGDQADLEGMLRPEDTFDLIVAQSRAETGERLAGRLLYAGVEHRGKPKLQLMRWGPDGTFYEASGVGEQRGGLMQPVNASVGSRFGMRRHPILGYVRLHAGLDYRARYGQPIVAVTDGRVIGAGRAGGCGNAVKLDHGSGIQTRYCHMSEMAVAAGESVRRGQVIGYVGSTGLSTGAHLHYEMYRNGRAVDPASVSYVSRALLSGADLAAFRSALATLKRVEPGAALADLAAAGARTGTASPRREIDRLVAAAPTR